MDREASPQVRKRQHTRSVLVRAARNLVFDRGHEKISISDITREAGVGTGTFYNYFQTKQGVFKAVLDDYRSSFEKELDGLRKNLKDPAMIVATTLKFYFRQAQDNEMWSSFVTYSGLPGEHNLHQEENQCFADIQRGVQAGRFKVTDVSFAQNLVIGMVIHTNREINNGNLGRSAMDHTTQFILRMLGLPDLVARALTQGALPAVRAPRHTVDPGRTEGQKRFQLANRQIMTNSG